MRSKSNKPYDAVEYYLLGDGFADVYLHKNQTISRDEEGNEWYEVDEVYFKIEESVSKEAIEKNFEYMWEDAINVKIETTATIEERVAATEIKVVSIEETIETIFGGV